MTDLTEGLRIYAIGDIHGRLDLLDPMLDRIRADLAAPAACAAARGLSRRLRRPRAGGARGPRGADGARRPGRCRRASSSATTTTTSSAYLKDPALVRRDLNWLARTWAATRRSPPTVCPRRRRSGRRWRATPSRPPSRPGIWPSSRTASSLPHRRLPLRPRRHPARRADRRAGARGPYLDPRALPRVEGRLRLQGGPRPHHRAGGRAPPEPDRRRHRRGQDRQPLLRRARRRRGGAAHPGGPKPLPVGAGLAGWRRSGSALKGDHAQVRRCI